MKHPTDNNRNAASERLVTTGIHDWGSTTESNPNPFVYRTDLINNLSKNFRVIQHQNYLVIKAHLQINSDSD